MVKCFYDFTMRWFRLKLTVWIIKPAVYLYYIRMADMSILFYRGTGFINADKITTNGAVARLWLILFRKSIMNRKVRKTQRTNHSKQMTKCVAVFVDIRISFRLLAFLRFLFIKSGSSDRSERSSWIRVLILLRCNIGHRAKLAQPVMHTRLIRSVIW